MPFSLENASFNNPFLIHLYISIGSPKHYSREKCSVTKIFVYYNLDIQFDKHLLRYIPSNGPKYEIIADEISISPVINSIDFSNFSAFSLHLSFSELKPSDNILALCIYFSHSTISFSNLSLFFIV